MVKERIRGCLLLLIDSRNRMGRGSFGWRDEAIAFWLQGLGGLGAVW